MLRQCSGEVKRVLITICLTTNVQLKGNKTFQQLKSSETSIHHANFHAVGWTVHAAKAKYALLLNIRLLDISLK